MFDAQHRLSSTLAYVTSMANYIAFFFFFFFFSFGFFLFLSGLLLVCLVFSGYG